MKKLLLTSLSVTEDEKINAPITVRYDNGIEVSVAARPNNYLYTVTLEFESINGKVINQEISKKIWDLLSEINV